MSALLNFLNGEVPGGIAVPVVLIIAFLLVLEFVYRASEYMPRTAYRRWRLLGPVAVLLIYAAFWIQSPPKIEPLRVAVILDVPDLRLNWRADAVTDLTGRRLERTLKGAVVNPWEGAPDEYPAPTPEALVKSKYSVYKIKWAGPQEEGIAPVQVSKPDGSGSTFPIARENLSIISKELGRWILSDLGRREQVQSPFSREIASEVLEMYYQARSFLGDAEPDSAESLFIEALEADPVFTQVKIGLAQCYEALGDRQRAENELLQAVRADTASTETLLALGEFYLRGLDWEKAEPPLKVVLTLNPMRVRTYLALARIHPERLKDLRYNTVEKLLTEAVRLDPAFETARIALAGPLMKQGGEHKARKLLQAGLSINPASIDLLLKAGALELYSGHPDAAIDYYGRILDYDPQNPLASFNLGVVYYRMKDYENARKHFSNSLGWDGPIDGYYYMGLIYQNKGDKPRARFYFNKRWKLRESDDDVYAVKAKELAAILN